MDFDVIVIGAGVIGLAVAREFALQGRQVLVLERNAGIGMETSARNSEVIHAGIYYPQGSLKARMCVAGRELLYAYCDSHGIGYRRTGKLIVATEEEQLPQLDALMQKGRVNGVLDLAWCEAEELHELEPGLCAVRAIHSPSTGIIDTHQYLLSLQGELESNDGLIAFNSAVSAVEQTDFGYQVTVPGESGTQVSAGRVVNCAGLGAQAVSHCVTGIRQDSIPARFLSRGCYFSLHGPAPFRRLVYPLPSNDGLGVHLTLDMQGRARFGPDAEWVDSIDYRVDPARAAAFYPAVRNYYPGLADGALQPDYAGIRPRVVGAGQPPGDFIVQGADEHGMPGYVALYGIESPGLTASLALARHVCTMLD